jgi:hypothetical protein
MGNMLWMLIGGSIMLLMFVHAVWCAAGVVCGFGLDRTLCTIEGLLI